MKLYDSSRTPNGRRVHVFLGEKQRSIPVESLDYGSREYAGEAFRALNPFAQVPILVTDDGDVISETVAICRYIEWHHPEPNLFGADISEQINVEMWNRRAELGFFYYVAQAFRHRHPYMKDHEIPQIAEWADSCHKKAVAILPLFDERLSGRNFLAEDKITIADITLMVAVEFMRAAKIPMSDSLVSLKGWFERMQARPSAACRF